MRLTILDKYIIKKFLSTYFFMLGVIMLLSMVFDISARLSEFIDNKAPIKEIFLDYYLNFLIYYGNTFSPLIIFISVIWFTAKMAQETEIIPMIFSGRAFTRILRPYIIAATLLVIISLFMNNFLLPLSNKVRYNFEEKYYRNSLFVENIHAEIKDNSYLYFSSFNSENNIIQNLTIENWKNNKPISFLRSLNAENIKGTYKWKLNNLYIRNINFKNEKLIYLSEKDTLFDFKIEDLAMKDFVSEKMTQIELKNFIIKEEKKGSNMISKFKLTYYERTSLPFATYILTIIGVSVSSRKKRGGIGLNIAIGLGFVFVYIFAMKVMNVAALKIGFPPILAVWLPNFIFATIALFLYKLAPK